MKLIKNYYYGKNGEKKINCYMIHLSKKLIQLANIDDTKDIKIYTKEGKIIIEGK